MAVLSKKHLLLPHRAGRAAPKPFIGGAKLAETKWDLRESKYVKVWRFRGCVLLNGHVSTGPPAVSSLQHSLFKSMLLTSSMQRSTTKQHKAWRRFAQHFLRMQCNVQTPSVIVTC